MAVTTLTRGIPETSLNSNAANGTAGVSFALPQSKLGTGWSIGWMMTFTGGPSAVSDQLEGSLDGTNWYIIGSAVTTIAGSINFAAGVVARFVRVYHTSKSGGTNVLAQILIN